MIDIKAGNQLYILQLKLKTQDYNVTNYIMSGNRVPTSIKWCTISCVENNILFLLGTDG
jgi:hypothetical protein